MEPLTVKERYELFIGTLTKCSSQVVTLPDEQLEYSLFEDCFTEMRTYLHESNLADLRNAGYIDDVGKALAKMILDDWISLERTPSTAEAVRASPDWKRLFEMCDRMLQHQHRNQQ